MAASTPSREVPDIVPKAQMASDFGIFPSRPRAVIPRSNLKHESTMTYHPKSDFMHVMIKRGFLADCTDYQALDEALVKGIVPGYIGFDATAKSLHVGSLIQIMMLHWLQKCGGKPIVLMGGGTTKVGDPSFRAEERPLLTNAQIDDNIAGIKRAFGPFVSFGDGPQDAIMVNNAEWLDDLNYLSFLRDIGRHFSVNRMLSFESVKSRLDREQSLSFLEFNYMILQAYDFMELNRRYGCLVQMGGSDQWGNIVNGVDLTRRVLDREVYGLTSHLLTTSDGKKMGKSQNGAVWLNGNMTSPYEFWQYWRNTTDADVGRFLKLYTNLPLDECTRLGSLSGAEINEAKVVLANAITALLHGVEASKAAEATAREVFENGGVGEDLPTVRIPASELGDGVGIVQLFVRAGLSGSGKDAKRLILEGGARVNDEIVTDTAIRFGAGQLVEPMKLTAGKKRHALVVID
jgi:tyrosyl-tRNA synthetase